MHEEEQALVIKKLHVVSWRVQIGAHELPHMASAVLHLHHICCCHHSWPWLPRLHHSIGHVNQSKLNKQGRPGPQARASSGRSKNQPGIMVPPVRPATSAPIG